MANIGVIMNGGPGETERKKHDFYATPPGTTRPIVPLLQRIFPTKVWECCCGEGDMSLVLKDAGFDVVSTDLVYRGYGKGGIDFLRTIDAEATAIATNPPFDVACDIIEHALCILGIEHLALILPAGFWYAQRNAKLFATYRPQYVLPCTWRIDNTGQGSPTMNIQWCVWTTSRQVLTPMNAVFAPLTSTEKHPGRFPADDPLR
jgi:hypothetical protein